MKFSSIITDVLRGGSVLTYAIYLHVLFYLIIVFLLRSFDHLWICLPIRLISIRMTAGETTSFYIFETVFAAAILHELEIMRMCYITFFPVGAVFNNGKPVTKMKKTT